LTAYHQKPRQSPYLLLSTNVTISNFARYIICSQNCPQVWRYRLANYPLIKRNLLDAAFITVPFSPIAISPPYPGLQHGLYSAFIGPCTPYSVRSGVARMRLCSAFMRPGGPDAAEGRRAGCACAPHFQCAGGLSSGLRSAVIRPGVNPDAEGEASSRLEAGRSPDAEEDEEGEDECGAHEAQDPVK
jgi:hypothetical protein